MAFFAIDVSTSEQCDMELLQLKVRGSGYGGCVADADGYTFFKCSRKGHVKKLKHYPVDTFESRAQFIAMMQKFATPPGFLDPPLPIEALTIDSLDRAHALLSNG